MKITVEVLLCIKNTIFNNNKLWDPPRQGIRFKIRNHTLIINNQYHQGNHPNSTMFGVTTV